jgi:hypothetical protein
LAASSFFSVSNGALIGAALIDFANAAQWVSAICALAVAAGGSLFRTKDGSNTFQAGTPHSIPGKEYAGL